MASRLFADFDPVSESQWKMKIQMDLKGADYNQTLVNTTADGIHIKPIYHRDTAPQIQVPSHANDSNDWYVSQKIYGGNATAANKKAIDAIHRGAQGIALLIPHADVDLEELFKDLPQHGIQVHLPFFDLNFIEKVYHLRPQVYVHIDVIHQLARYGNWFVNKDQDLRDYGTFLKKFDRYFSNITVNTSTYQEAGATVVQELAYYLAHLNEYLMAYCDGVSRYGVDLKYAFAKAENTSNKAATKPQKRVNIDTTVGSNYFIEIAKYRVYRILTKTLGDAYGLHLSCYITATPGLRNKSLLDYNVNMLRTTTECMSAVLGGADTVHNLPYDSFFNKENEFGDRIARNQLLILKEEAYLNKVSNAADGAYYINALVKELADKALDVFKSLENSGGFISALFEGTIQRKIKESDRKEREAFDNKEKILVGVNKFPNEAQPLQSSYEILPFQKIETRKTLIAPIVPKRIAEDLEKSKMPKE